MSHDTAAVRPPDIGDDTPYSTRASLRQVVSKAGAATSATGAVGRWIDGRGPAIVLGAAAALAGTALVVNWQAERMERRHPPIGKFIEVDGVRLHYVEAGDGPPVVLLHGNSSMLNDPLLSIFERLSKGHRVVAFDRPGFGFSERPKTMVWTADAQAALFRQAFRALGLDRPVLYGHSFAASIVISFALDYPEETRGVVAASGYYYPARRVDSLIAWMNYLPVIGTVLRNTLTPLQGALAGKLMVRLMFDPKPVPPSYERFPAGLALRPSHLRAAAEDGATMRAWAKRFFLRYGAIGVPVMIVSGSADRVVDYKTQSLRLHRDVRSSSLQIWPDTGHMVHHTRAAEVIDAIEAVFRADAHAGVLG